MTSRVLRLLIVFALPAAWTAEPDLTYCKLTPACPVGAVHNMCTNKYDNPGGDCEGILQEDAYFTFAQKEGILRKHNDLRALVLNDIVKGQPAAQVMEDLEWDRELERMAKRWALQCPLTSQPCRLTGHLKTFGENLAVDTFSNKRPHFDLQVQAWFNENKHFPKKLVDRYNVTRRPTGHYTQMVWSSTRRLGCERAVYRTDDARDAGAVYADYLVCLYSPAGNVVGQPIYAIEDAVVVAPVEDGAQGGAEWSGRDEDGPEERPGGGAEWSGRGVGKDRAGVVELHGRDRVAVGRDRSGDASRGDRGREEGSDGDFEGAGDGDAEGSGDDGEGDGERAGGQHRRRPSGMQLLGALAAAGVEEKKNVTSPTFKTPHKQRPASGRASGFGAGVASSPVSVEVVIFGFFISWGFGVVP